MSAPRITVLDQQEIESIHTATLRILSQTGIVLSHPGAIEMLADRGAQQHRGRILLPVDLVEWALAQCPAQFTVTGRDGKQVTLGDGSLHWHNLGGARDVFEPQGGTMRPAGVEDVARAARLLDALDACTCITPFFTPQDVPGAVMSLAMYRHTLPHTSKPVYAPGVQTAREVRLAARMAEVVGDPAASTMIAISPISPLTFPDHLVGAMLETARLGIPFGPLPCPTAGTTAPLSIAGALAQQNSEVVASIVLTQLANPGLPVMYCGRLAMMEPRTAISVWGGVELGLASAGTVQIAHHYNLPVNVYGFSTNAHTLDLQSGYERALNAVVPALAGADELSGIGEMAAGVASSFAQMVIDDEIAASVRRLRRGFSADDEALGVEVVASVMDGSRNYLVEDHTLRYLRSGEILVTRLAERGSWADGDPAAHDIAHRAQSRADHILATYTPVALDPQQEAALDEILNAALTENT